MSPYRLFFSLACFTATAAFGAVKEKPCLDGPKVHRATIRHIESGGIGYDDGYTTLETFLAADPNWWSVMPFLDARAHVFNDGRWATNVGVGLRRLTGKRAYGVNAYYDYRNGSKLSYNQIGLGFETLGKLVDFRVNGYLPVGRKITSAYGTRFGGFSGHHMLLSQKHQFAFKGVDAEVGFHFGKSKSFDFYTAIGPYYYRGEMGPNVWGGKARIAGVYKEMVSLELSDSYDGTFRNKFQGQLGLNFFFGPKSKVKKKGPRNTCEVAETFNQRMLQPVGRQEIIPVDSKRKKTVARDPATGEPLFFVFVDNTSSSLGTYESPYPTFAEAQANSAPGNILYVFPGDGTTAGMNSGIFLKADQKFWGSGTSHSIQTTQGSISIPAQTTTSPTITNTNIDTEGNAVTLATNNAISGFTITSALNDAIIGTDAQNLDVSFCTFENTTTFPIEATFSGDATISLTNNQFLNNVNGVALTLNGTSNVVCTNNTFEGQTSVSNVPIEISADSNILVAQIENNLFNGNTTGTVRFSLSNVVDTDINVLNNVITNNGTGAQSSLGSSIVVLSNGTNENCSIVLQDNTLTGNTSNALYMHTSGAFGTLAVTATANTVSGNGGSALVVATPVDHLTLLVTDNTITNCNDNGIAVIGSGLSTTGTITLNGNSITGIGNASNGIAINQDFTTLELTILNNTVNECEGSGILSYAPNGIDSLILNISDNTISNCLNNSSNAASGLDIEQYTSLSGTFANNTLSDNVSSGFFIGSAAASPSVCLTMTGNNTDSDFTLNSGTGTFNLAPCNVETINTGTFNTIGTVTIVQSCPGAVPCPP